MHQREEEEEEDTRSLVSMSAAASDASGQVLQKELVP